MKKARAKSTSCASLLGWVRHKNQPNKTKTMSSNGSQSRGQGRGGRCGGGHGRGGRSDSSRTGGQNTSANDNAAMLHPRKLDDVKFVAGDARTAAHCKTHMDALVARVSMSSKCGDCRQDVVAALREGKPFEPEDPNDEEHCEQNECDPDTQKKKCDFRNKAIEKLIDRAHEVIEKRKLAHSNNARTVGDLMWTKCSLSLQTRIANGVADAEVLKQDGLLMKAAMELHSAQAAPSAHPLMSLSQSTRAFVNVGQKEAEKNEDHFQRVVTQAQILAERMGSDAPLVPLSCMKTDPACNAADASMRLAGGEIFWIPPHFSWIQSWKKSKNDPVENRMLRGTWCLPGSQTSPQQVFQVGCCVAFCAKNLFYHWCISCRHRSTWMHCDILFTIGCRLF